ncbi:MAG: hypothetical protein AB1916_00450 [Thermodesulfobacteriota bacterium]
MPDEASDRALLKAVELLMGQFSEQILALLEAHARGDVEPEAFEARIRDLVGAVSPEALARHPGRLARARPASPSFPAAGEPPPVDDAVFPLPPGAVRPESPPAPLDEEIGAVDAPAGGFEVEFEPEAPEPLPEMPASAEAGPGFVASSAQVPEAAVEIPFPGLAGVEPLPEISLPGEPPAEEGGAEGEDRLLGSGPAPEPPGPCLAEPSPSGLDAPLILDGVSGYELLPEFELEARPEEAAASLPAPEAAVVPEPLGLELEAPASPEPLHAAEPVVPEPSPVVTPAPEPAVALLLDGVSGYEPLPEFELEARPEEAAAPLPEPEAAAVPPAASAESEPAPLVLDGVSGYEHLLEPEPPDAEPPAEVKAKVAAPKAEPPPARPAAPAPPRKGPATKPPLPSPTPGGRPAPSPPVPASAPKEAKAPAKPAAAPPPPAKPPGPPPRRPRPAGMGSVVVSGRMGADDLKAPDRPVLGFGDQMFGNGQQEENGGDREISFVSRQVRRDLQDKTTWKSPAKAAILSGLLPGVGDFYLGNVATGVVFYLVFYVLLMLFILRGDLVLLPALLVLALTSAGVSWLSANKHNEAIHRMQDVPGLRQKTRETTFTFDHTRRRR